MKDSWTSVDVIGDRIRDSKEVTISTGYLQIEFKMSYQMANMVYPLLVKKGVIHKDGTVIRLPGSKWL